MQGKRLVLWMLLACCAGLGPATAMAQSSCGWLETAELDRLLPGGAPWQVMVGGRFGSCKFVGRSAGQQGSPVIGANQMLQADAEAAAALATSLRARIGADYRVDPVQALGEHGFRYTAREGDAAGRFTSFVGHRGRLVATGQLVLPLGADAADWQEGAIGVYQAALAAGENSAAAAAVSGCPWFHEPSLRMLLPGASFSQQVFGETSCMAQDGTGAALILSIREAMEGVDLRDASCTWTSLPLAGAALGQDCSGGRPRLLVQVQRQGRVFSYAFAPGREPTAAEQEALQAMVGAVHGGG